MKQLSFKFLLGLLLLQFSAYGVTTTLTLNPTSTGWCTSSAATSGDLSVSNAANRGYAVFNLNGLSIPSGCVVTSVTLGFTISAITGTTTPTQTIYGYVGDITSLGAGSRYAACTTGTTTLYTLTWGTTAVTKTMATTAAAVSFVSGNLSNTVSVCWVESVTGNRAYSINGTTSPVPVLTVQYCNAPTALGITQSPNPVCSGASLSLTGAATGAAAGGYSWTGPAGFSSTMQNPTAFTCSTVSAGVYTFNATSACGSVATTTKTIVVNTTAPAAITGGFTPLCGATGATETLSNSVSGGIWTSSTPSNATVNPTTGVVTSVTTGTTTVSYNTGCGSAATFAITVGAVPAVACTPSSANYCFGTFVSLVGSGATTYSWSPATDLSVTTGATTHATPSSTTTYTVTGSNAAGCSNTATATVSHSASGDMIFAPTASAAPATTCSGGLSTLSSAITNSNYNTVTSITYAAAAITGTSILAGADDDNVAVTIPFNFNFYGTNYTSVNVCSNGFINFGTPAIDYSPLALPDGSAPEGIVALFWHDLDLNSGGNIKYTTSGTTPNRKFIISFNAVSDFGGGPTNTGQIILYETSNNIDILIASVSEASGTAVTVGVQDLYASMGVTPSGRNNTTFDATNEAWHFTGVPTSGYNYSWAPAAALSSSTSASPVASPVTSTTIYTLTVSDAGSGCFKTATTTVTIGSITGTISPSTTACTGGSTNVVFTGPAYGTATYTINGGSPITTSLDATGSATVSTGALFSTTTYVLTTVGSGACSASVTGQSETITLVSPPTVTVSPTTATYCAGTPPTLTASGTATAYSWAPSAGLSATTGSSVTATPTSNTVYTLTGTIGSCAVTATATVNAANGPFTISASAIPTVTCVGGSAVLSNSIINTNFNTATSITYAAVSTAGTSVLAGVDDDYVTVALPFTFSYYGLPYTSVNICSNGFINFGTPAVDYYPVTLPSSGAPEGIVALFWHDLELSSSGNIKYQTLGTAPNRKFVVSYNAVPDLDGSGPNTGQIILYETSNLIDLLISTSTSDVEAVCGMQDLYGTQGVTAPARNNVVFAASTEAWHFTGVATSGYTYSWAPAASMSSSTASSPTASPISSASTFTVTATDATTGCMNSATVLVNTGTLTGTISGTTTICSGNVTNLVFTGPATATATYTINGGTPRTIVLDATGSATLTSDTLFSTTGTSTTYTFAYTHIDIGTCSIPLTGINAVITVKTAPGAITGAAAICISSTTTLANSVSGGTWSNTPTTMGTVNSSTGVFTSTSTTGTSTVSYTISSCPAVTRAMVVGSASPAAITPATAVNICVGATSTLADATASGAWTSSNTALATVTSGGVVRGVSNGTVTISYSTGCGTAATKSVNINGASITLSNNGPLCSGSNLNLTASLSSSGTGYSWTGPNSFTSTSLTPTISSATTSAAGTYSFSATISGCANSATMNVVVDPLPTVTVTASPSSVCTGSTSSLSDVIVAPTDYLVNSTTYGLVTMTGTVAVTGDDATAAVTIPFNFNYYGTNYTSVNVCTNGFINFGTPAYDFSPLALPDASAPEGIIALFWHDMDQTAGGTIKYATVGTSPNRQFVVYYNNVSDYTDNTIKNTGQIVLYETTNKIDLIVLKTNLGNGNDLTCGLQDLTGSQGTAVPGQNYTNYSVTAGEAHRFTKPTYTYSWAPSTGLSSTTIANPVASSLTSTRTYTVTTRDIYSGCTGNVTTQTITVAPYPTAYTITGGGGYCTVPGTGVHIGLTSSDTGVHYQLYKGASTVGSPIAGTGSALDFGLFTDTAGAYTVQATNNLAPCNTNMTGSVHVSVNTSPTVYSLTGGNGCTAPGVTIGLSNSQSGVSYQLFNSGTGGTTLSGTGSALSYGSITTAGTYTIVGTGAGGCTSNMTGASIIGTSPTAYAVTGGSGGCGGSGVAVGVANSQSGVNYQMYLNGSTSGGTVPGTAAAISFGTQTTPGTYTAVGTLGSCSTNMTGNAIVSVATSVSLGGNPSVCQPISSATISYSSAVGSPTTYNITWGATALADGFSNVSAGTLSGGIISLIVPNTSVHGVYTGTISVSNGSCTSSAYSFTLTVYENPTASISSAVSPCSGYATNIVFSGTSAADIDYTIDGGSPATVTLTGGTYSLSTGVFAGSHTYVLVKAHNPACSNAIGSSATVTAIPMQWTGTTSTDWNNAANWSCGFVPGSSDDATIPAGTTYAPAIAASASGTTRNLTIVSGASVTVNSAATLNVMGNLTNNGSVTGAGKLSMDNSSAQTVNGFGSVSCFDVNNSAGVTVATGSRLTVKSILSVTSGSLATSDSVVLYSDTFGSARVAVLPSGTSITGNVKVNQFFSGGRRAYRFWGHPFSNYIGLDQLENYVDITGTGGATNGFTTTGSNQPSAYRYNPYVGNSSLSGDPGWRPFASTYTTQDSNRLHQYQGIRVYYRGAKGEGLGFGPYVVISSTTGSQWGTLNQGNQNVSLARGTSSTQDYNMVGNPYASPVDIGTVVFNAASSGRINGAYFYIWNPFLNTAGAFQAVPYSTGGGSPAAIPYYLQANDAFQVRAMHDGDQLNFVETNKSATISNAYSLMKARTEFVSLYVYDANYHPFDMLYVKFDDAATNDEDTKFDGGKPSGNDFNFYSLSADKHKLMVDARPYAAEGIIPIGVTSSYAQDYIIRAENIAVPEGGKVYLHDKLLGQYVLLQQGTEYRFSVTKDKNTQGENRFELSMEPATVKEIVYKGLDVKVTPNPASDEVKISFTQAKGSNVAIRILDLSGSSVYNQSLGMKQNGGVTIPLSNLASGIYMVELTADDQKVVQRLIKE